MCCKKGGGGGLGPKSLCTKNGLTRQDFPNGKFRFFPRWSLWSGGGGGGYPPPPAVYGHSNTSLPLPSPGVQSGERSTWLHNTCRLASGRDGRVLGLPEPGFLRAQHTLKLCDSEEQQEQLHLGFGVRIVGACLRAVRAFWSGVWGGGGGHRKLGQTTTQRKATMQHINNCVSSQSGLRVESGRRARDSHRRRKGRERAEDRYPEMLPHRGPQSAAQTACGAGGCPPKCCAWSWVFRRLIGRARQSHWFAAPRQSVGGTGLAGLGSC